MFRSALTISRRGFAAAAGSEKIAMVGSGNFGSALVRILGQNALRHDVFDNEVRMYVHEEMIDGASRVDLRACPFLHRPRVAAPASPSAHAMTWHVGVAGLRE